MRSARKQLLLVPSSWHFSCVLWNDLQNFVIKQDTKFNYCFIISILKLQISFIHIQVFSVFTNILLIQFWASLWKVAKVVFHFPAIWLVPLNKSWYLIGCCVLVKLSHKLALMRANQIARITYDFKMNVKDSELQLYMSF